MLSLDKQERFRQRYRQIAPGWQPALEVYTGALDSLVTADLALLDIGCGPGGLVRKYEGRACCVIGVDEHAASFRHLAEIAALVSARLDALPFPNAAFDLVTCSWVMEHIAQPDSAVAEIARVLRPGGHFLFITPNKHNYVVLLRRLVPNALSRLLVSAIYKREEHFINPTYYRLNARSDIDRVMNRHGMMSVSFRYVSDPTYLAFNALAFRAAAALERLLDRFGPQMRVHLVGLYRKE